MKNKGVILIVITLGLFAFSCNKKNYTCTCFTSGLSYVIEDATQGEADAECNSNESDPFNGNCEISSN